MSKAQPASVMLVGRRHGPGPLVYLREIAGGQLISSWWRIGRLTLPRIVFKMPVKNDGISCGSWLVVADYPKGKGWLHTGRFKPPCKKGPGERPKPTENDLASPHALVQWLEGLSFDYWEKGNFLTAEISEPEIHQDDSDKVRNPSPGEYVCGSCDDFEAYDKELWNSDVVKELLDDTERNKIVFWKTDETDWKKLFDEVIPEASSLMWLSIRQALAGPHKKSASWVGRPVTDKVDEIYRNHLNNRNRAVGRERRSQEDYTKNARHQRTGGRPRGK